MAGRDGTGPLRTGSIGRGLRPCGGGQAGWGRGRGFRRGGGAAWDMIPAAMLPDEEKVLLERQKNWLEAQLAVITQRLQENIASCAAVRKWC